MLRRLKAVRTFFIDQLLTPNLSQDLDTAIVSNALRIDTTSSNFVALS